MTTGCAGMVTMTSEVAGRPSWPRGEERSSCAQTSLGRRLPLWASTCCMTSILAWYSI